MTSSIESFKHKSSVLRRLNGVIVLVVLSFVVEFIGVVYSNHLLMNEFSHIHLTNQVYDLLSIISDSADHAALLLNKVSDNEQYSSDLQKVFEVSYTQADNSLKNAILMSQESPLLETQLLKTKNKLLEFQRAADNVFERRSENTDLLIAQEYKLELDESLKKTQILIKSQGTKAFERVYDLRYLPLLMASFITIICVSFTVLMGGAIIRRLKKSINNLLYGTKIVAGGNLYHQAKILENDELGFVTYVFNQMVNKFSKSKNSLNRLYIITTALSGEAEPEQVAAVILKESLSALTANSGIVVQLSSLGTEVEKIAELGYDQDALKDWERFPIERKSSITEAIQTGTPIWVESLEQHYKKWPNLVPKNSTGAYIILPLAVGEKVIGAMTISFLEERIFNTEDREFCMSIAGQCAQALNRAQLYKEAQHAIQIRDEFLSIASHELRTPITPLKLQIQSLLRLIQQEKFSMLTPAQVMKMVGTADTQINRLTKLVDELLDVTRITKGNIELQKESLDVSKVVADVVAKFKIELAAVNCDVILNLAPNLVAELDHFRIEQVVTNLLSNAMRYGAGKPIEITTSNLNHQVEIKIQDHGMGIAPIDQKRIFERFERASSMTYFGGLGLGLFIVRQIVQQHHGSINVTSAVGEGSTFVVRLPNEANYHETKIMEMRV